MSDEQKTKTMAEVFRGIAQLIMQGTYPGTFAKLIYESVGILETMAIEDDKKREEKEAQEAAEEVAEEVKEQDEG